MQLSIGHFIKLDGGETRRNHAKVLHTFYVFHNRQPFNPLYVHIQFQPQKVDVKREIWEKQ
jgi:hypothetical protein